MFPREDSKEFQFQLIIIRPGSLGGMSLPTRTQGTTKAAKETAAVLLEGEMAEDKRYKKIAPLASAILHVKIPL